MNLKRIPTYEAPKMLQCRSTNHKSLDLTERIVCFFSTYLVKNEYCILMTKEGRNYCLLKNVWWSRELQLCRRQQFHIY